MEWFSFQLVDCSYFKWLLLDAKLSLEDISNAYKNFISDEAEELGNLLEEIVEVEENLEELIKEERFTGLDIGKKWALIFRKKTRRLSEKACFCASQYLPIKRLFRVTLFHFECVWTDEKNSFLISTVNAFVCVKCNFEMSSIDAYEYFLGQKELLERAKAGEKYGLC